MLLIIASAWDPSAPALARRWSDEGARVMTPVDFSRIGWRWRVGTSSASAAVTQAGIFDAGEIRGVLTRLPYVHEREIPNIAPADRTYVAAEIHAFLFAWLSALRCPVLNRPAAFSLCGPAWRAEQWLHLAAHVGLGVEPLHLVVKPGTDPPADAPALAHEAATVTIIGDRHIGLVDPALISQAHRLAAAAGVDLLQVTFSSALADAKFIGATLWPDLWDASMCDLIVAYFQRHTHADARASAP